MVDGRDLCAIAHHIGIAAATTDQRVVARAGNQCVVAAVGLYQVIQTIGCGGDVGTAQQIQRGDAGTNRYIGLGIGGGALCVGWRQELGQGRCVAIGKLQIVQAATVDGDRAAKAFVNGGDRSAVDHSTADG